MKIADFGSATEIRKRPQTIQSDPSLVSSFWSAPELSVGVDLDSFSNTASSWERDDFFACDIYSGIQGIHVLIKKLQTYSV